MAKLVELIVGKYDGSLKAEHGTGINMAPYVEREWGEKATELMWRVKQLADPDGVLAPGVVLNRDPGVHLRNLKTTPPIEESATTCVECGFCEPVCPSRNLTTTPRQRIVLRREMARQPAGSPVQRALLEEYEYDGARDLRRRRLLPARLPGRDRHRQAGQGAARRAQHGERAEQRGAARPRGAGARSRARSRGCGLRRRRRRWRGGRKRGAGAARRPACRRSCRLTPATTGRRRRLRPRLHQPDLRPARAGRRPSLVEALVAVSARRAAGLDPRRRRRQLLRRCPGARRASREAHRHKANEMVERLWALERGGGAAGRDRRRLLHPGRSPSPARACSTRRTPSASPSSRSSTRSPGPTTACCPGSRSAARSARPPSTRPAPPATWAWRRRLRSLAGALADEVYVAPSATCCGFAGDRGISHPELTAAATRDQAAELAGPRLRRPPLQQPHLRDRPRAAPPASAYESFVFLLERANRASG